jgi:hypothetical protein
MTRSEENKPPEHHEVLPEPAGSEPRVPQPGQANGEPKVNAGEADPKTRRSKPDLYILITAGISALAALLGALIGGISSYLVAQSNNAAEAESAQISRKETTYADFITHSSDLVRVDSDLTNHYKSHPADTAEQNQLHDALADEYSKWLHTDFIVRVVDSPEVDSARNEIYRHILIIRDLLRDLPEEVHSGKPIDQTTASLDSEYNGMYLLVNAFTKAAKDDVTPSKRKLCTPS